MTPFTITASSLISRTGTAIFEHCYQSSIPGELETAYVLLLTMTSHARETISQLHHDMHTPHLLAPLMYLPASRMLAMLAHHSVE